MDLGQYIYKNVGEKVKIGSDTCFFYCGEITKDTQATIKAISDNYLLGYKRMARLKKNRLAKETNKSKRKSLIKKYAKYVKLIDNFSPLLNRTIKEIYECDTIDEYGVKIIIISGKEHGKYWTIKEYEDDKKKIT